MALRIPTICKIRNINNLLKQTNKCMALCKSGTFSLFASASFAQNRIRTNKF